MSEISENLKSITSYFDLQGFGRNACIYEGVNALAFATNALENRLTQLGTPFLSTTRGLNEVIDYINDLSLSLYRHYTRCRDINDVPRHARLAQCLLQFEEGDHDLAYSSYKRVLQNYSISKSDFEQLIVKSNGIVEIINFSEVTPSFHFEKLTNELKYLSNKAVFGAALEAARPERLCTEYALTEPFIKHQQKMTLLDEKGDTIYAELYLGTGNRIRYVPTSVECS